MRSELQLCELYRQENIDRGVTETWRELGRTRWHALPPDEYLHFAPAGIRYVHGQLYRGGPAAVRWQAARRALGENPSLPACLEHVARDRYLEVADNPDSLERGRVRWLDRKGATKHVFRYQPSSVWMYRRSGVTVGSPPDGRPEPQRRRMARSLADALHALLLDGADYYSLEGARSAATGGFPRCRSLPLLH